MSTKDEAADSQSTAPQPKALTESQKKQLSTVKSKEVELRRWLRARKDFTEEEEGALKCQTYQEFAQYWSKVAEVEKHDLDQRRRSGWAKWGHGYQSFGTAVMGFMKDWEPLIDIIKGFGGVYGDMAVGTITVVFVIAKNKNTAEGYLSSALASIKDRMIGFALYGDIYKKKDLLEDDLRSKIISAYSLFVELSIQATKYYKGGGTWRWLRTIGRPTKFKSMATNIQKSIVAIRLRSEELLSRNVDEIKQDNKRLRGQVEELLESDDNKNMAEVNRLWKNGELPAEPNDDLITLRNVLNEELGANFDQFRPGDKKRQKFEASTEHEEWRTPKNSRILILVGHSEESIVVRQYRCWLSSIVLDHIEKRRTDGDIYACYLFEVRRETPMHDAMTSLLFQLLRFKKQALRKHINSFRPEDTKEFDALEETSRRVIKFFEPSETVYIMLDRVDKCREEERTSLLNILGRMVTEALCTLKILIVISGSDWTINLNEVDKKYRDLFKIYEERQEGGDELDY
ncbi:hypothetical protein G7Y89_g13804 [Cudoniella acicularis]|uniref:Uncharacterized protein n=1 Tax=Cudoniella acicularis TaxID=354080 RepID=A0A8H4R8T8_9HELO|nr:hypothetical protein G7Y89_g13804 [Cudoniella acicularis]